MARDPHGVAFYGGSLESGVLTASPGSSTIDRAQNVPYQDAVFLGRRLAVIVKTAHDNDQLCLGCAIDQTVCLIYAPGPIAGKFAA